MSTNKVSLQPDGKIRKIGVRSKSNPDQLHAVLVYPDGMITCPCKGYQFKKECRHLKKVRKYIDETDTEPKEEPIDAAPASDPMVDTEELDRLLSG